MPAQERGRPYDRPEKTVANTTHSLVVGVLAADGPDIIGSADDLSAVARQHLLANEYVGRSIEVKIEQPAILQPQRSFI